MLTHTHSTPNSTELHVFIVLDTIVCVINLHLYHKKIHFSLTALLPVITAESLEESVQAQCVF